ncbi:MAG: hypothetical protein H0W03_10040 [Solirubrobacterales bacterium]|nr:hypothetical protein [Solirubrobacterales bacterium]
MAREESTAELTALAGQEEAARPEQPALPARTAQRDWYHPERPGRFNGMALERAAAA